MKNRGLFARLGHAVAGIRIALQGERSLRTQLAAALALLVVLVILRPPPVWWALSIAMTTLVIAAELFNTALEYLADHLQPRPHPQIKIVKDCAAGAVLILSLGALAVGFLMLYALWKG